MPYLGRKISCIIPTKNEEDTIQETIKDIPEYVDEVLLVDASTDRTVEKASAIERKIRVIKQKDGGKGTALRLGFESASGEIIVTIDADHSHDPHSITDLVKRIIKDDEDMVIGSRFLGHSFDMTPIRLILNQLVTLILRLSFDINIMETQNGFRAIKREALEKMELRSDGFPIETEMTIKAAKHNLSVSEVPTIEYKRKSGSSKLNIFRLGFRIGKLILEEVTNRHVSTKGKKA